ncbi:MAG: hypothetical protein M1820_007326 [Bogoriella megaspora]|nr:MAG: hypothetical protein M1820_007326 [Bogoriella megaspora]
MNPRASVAEALAAVNTAAKDDVDGTGPAHLKLLDAIHRLNRAAEAPVERLTRIRWEPVRALAINAAIEIGAIQYIAKNKGRYVTAKELASATGQSELFISRIMRPITYEGICDETGEYEYAANDLTELEATPGHISAEQHHFEMWFPLCAKLLDFMREKGFSETPTTDPNANNLFKYTFGSNIWEYFPSHLEQAKHFNDLMSMRRVGFASWHDSYPFAERLIPGARSGSEDVLIVDVGGNKGHEVASFHDKHPDAPGRLIVQDLPPVVDSYKHNSPQYIEWMSHDFFTPQPIKGKGFTVKVTLNLTIGSGARTYFLQNVCHDWPDDANKTILSHIADAMEKDYSTLLICDYVLPDTGVTMRAALIDLVVMTYFASGIERTKTQWDRLLDECGLEIIGIWGWRSDWEQVIEARLKA